MTATAAQDCHRTETAAAPARRRTAQPRLSHDEEVELAARAARGDRQARDRMIEANLGLVHTIARDFLRRGLEMDDLVGEGHLGLFRAVDQFDPRHGVRFSIYAAYWIKEAIRAALIATAPTVRLPAGVVNLLTRWRRAERRLRAESGRAPSFDEVAADLCLSARERATVAATVRIRMEGSGGAGCDLRFDERLVAEGATAEEIAEAEDDRADALRRLVRLDDRERTVVTLRYGLGGEELTRAEIGRRLGITRQWARMLELHALRKLGEG